MIPYKLITLDLDGTLLNSKKELTSRARKALESAAKKGIEIVPTTGRVYAGLPQCIQDLPFVRYIISVNGANVYDRVNQKVLYTAEIPYTRAIELMEFLDTLPIIYDCFMKNCGWMTQALRDKANDYVTDEHILKMLYETRRAVPELKQYLAEEKHSVQKIQFFIKDMTMHDKLLKELPLQYPDFAVTSSLVNNVEINAREANKGQAMMKLAEILGIQKEEIMSFGDGLNDISMIKEAGMGIAMKNSCDEILAAAKHITLSCDEDGVAAAIEELCLR